MSSPTYAELKKQYVELQRQHEKQLNALSKEMEAARKAEMSTAVSEIRQIMQNYGITDADLGKIINSKHSSSSKTKTVKYRGPEGQEWSGRGRRPRWTSGIDLESCKVAS